MDEVVDFLLNGIENGTFSMEERIPSEEALAELSGASRLTVREATKVLAGQRVLKSVQGSGTYVAPVEEWLSIDALVRIKQGTPVK
ncbi:winged helix-turn-helix transcriptional regulator [Tessaracoccus sp. HDW20]|uniref:FadR/GntR family transcriptional regulator n=1 Tax=Tessaracoccus coleopterorum TaxID=2714950 RepID=UPI0018D4D5E4|nr:winged helix-turn-helix transcriptional regulator [Tessaracoccus coleopterorum]